MIVQPVLEPMEHYTALVTTENILSPGRHQAVAAEGNCPVFICTTISNILSLGHRAAWAEVEPGQGDMCGLR